jgi:hypothetical protein
MLYTAFDPSSCALFAHVIEQAAFTCLCPISRPRIIPHARLWLRRNSERALDAIMEDVTETALDAVNSVEPTMAIVLILILWLRVVVVANTKDADDQS